MARRRVRFPVGRRRIGAGVSPSQAGYTRLIRKQMEGIERNLTAVLNSIEGLTPGAIEYALQPMFEASQRFVPVDRGPLKDSGFIATERTSRGAVGVIGYGQPGNAAKGRDPADYAVFVHERMDLKHAPPTRAKYLEEAVNQESGNVVKRATDFIKRGTGIDR